MGVIRLAFHPVSKNTSRYVVQVYLVILEIEGQEKGKGGLTETAISAAALPTGSVRFP